MFYSFVMEDERLWKRQRRAKRSQRNLTGGFSFSRNWIVFFLDWILLEEQVCQEPSVCVSVGLEPQKNV